MTRPTDADVDGNSRVYCASWRGATFDWAGPDVGYIVCVKPKGFQPAPMPLFGKATDGELIETLKSKSYRRRIEAQRELMRRGNNSYQNLLETSIASRSADRNLLDCIQTTATEQELVQSLGHTDPVVVHTAIRCAAQRGIFAACFKALDEGKVASMPILRALAMMHRTEVVDGLLARLDKTTASQLRREMLFALCRLHFVEGVWKGDSWGTRPDTRGPYYQPEPWSETQKIASALRKLLDKAIPDEAGYLIETIQRNRIESNDSLDRMLTLAKTNEQLLGPAISQLASAKEIPAGGMELLLRLVNKSDASPAMLSDAVIALSKTDSKETPLAIVMALSKIRRGKETNNDRKNAREAFVNSEKLDMHVAAFEELAKGSDTDIAFWAEAALLAIGSRKNGSPETQQVALKAIETLWQQSDRRGRLMLAAAEIGNRSLDSKILKATEEPDESVAKIAKSVVKQLKIVPATKDTTPKISTLSAEEAIAQVVSTHGDVAHGKEVFAKANCGACHTVRQTKCKKARISGQSLRLTSGQN